MSGRGGWIAVALLAGCGSTPDEPEVRAGTLFAFDSDFGDEAARVREYVPACADVLVDMLATPDVPPPAQVTIRLEHDPDLGGIGGWASGERMAIGFECPSWQPMSYAHLWIVAHELTNLYVAHYAGSGGFPSDWWSNGRSPFPEYASCLVMAGAGHPDAAEWRREDGRGQPDHDLYWELHERHGFALFARFFELLRQDALDLGEIEPAWPMPSGRRSLYTAAYLSLSAGENLAPLVRAAGIGREPPGWSEAHPDWPFVPYSIEDTDVDAVLARRAELFGDGVEATQDLEAARDRFRAGDHGGSR